MFDSIESDIFQSFDGTIWAWSKYSDFQDKIYIEFTSIPLTFFFVRRFQNEIFIFDFQFGQNS